ncbi:hypothetical protein [Cyanobium gracile]|nr:hypothetical protein [Cyanobium gracile]
MPQLDQPTTRSSLIRQATLLMLTTALGLILWPQLTLAQANKVPNTLGAKYDIPGRYIRNVTQINSVKRYSKIRVNENIYQVKVVVPYEPGCDMDFDFLVDCSNGRMARAQGIEVAESRLEAAYYTYHKAHLRPLTSSLL